MVLQFLRCEKTLQLNAIRNNDPIFFSAMLWHANNFRMLPQVVMALASQEPEDPNPEILKKKKDLRSRTEGVLKLAENRGLIKKS